MLLAHDKDHKKVFHNVPVVGFRNGKSLKDYLVRAALPKSTESGRCEPCEKKSCLFCNSIRTTKTFKTEVCGETFKIQSGASNWDSEKLLYLFECKVCGEAPYVEKVKTKFRYRFNNHKSKHTAFRKRNRKVPQKLFHNHYCLNGHLEIDDWDFSFLSNVKHISNWKREKPSGSPGLKLFTHYVLMRKRSTFISIPLKWKSNNQLWRKFGSDLVLSTFQPFKRQSHKMVKHTQTIHWEIADELFECLTIL